MRVPFVPQIYLINIISMLTRPDRAPRQFRATPRLPVPKTAATPPGRTSHPLFSPNARTSAYLFAPYLSPNPSPLTPIPFLYPPKQPLTNPSKGPILHARLANRENLSPAGTNLNLGSPVGSRVRAPPPQVAARIHINPRRSASSRLCRASYPNQLAPHRRQQAGAFLLPACKEQHHEISLPRRGTGRRNRI